MKENFCRDFFISNKIHFYEAVKIFLIFLCEFVYKYSLLCIHIYVPNQAIHVAKLYFFFFFCNKTT